MYPSGHKDHDSPREERSLCTSSPSSRNEDMEMGGLEESSSDDAEPPIQSVVGPDGLREFIMLPQCTVNVFNSTIKDNHFKTLRTKYQIPDNISIRLPYKSEKNYYKGVEGVEVYEQMLKAGLRFPLSSLHRELLKHLGLSINQVSLNAWRVFLAVEVLYGAITNGARRLMVREFLHYYRPDEIDKSRGMYSFVPRSPLLRLVYETLDSNRNLKNRYFFLEGDEWMYHPRDTEHMPIDIT